MKADDAVIWHDVENGGYDTDLETWRRLAGERSGTVLDLGCGTGRVAVDLARRGHPVCAVDNDERLLERLRWRAWEEGLEIEVLEGDLRDLDLGDRRFALALAPMQVLQLLGGAEERVAALRSVRAALEPRGTFAAAIVENAPAETWDRDDHPPLPDVREADEWVYSSLPVAVRPEEGKIVVERLRQVVGPAGELSEEPSQIELSVLDTETLEAEAAQAGFEPELRAELPEDDRYAASVIVRLRAGGVSG